MRRLVIVKGGTREFSADGMLRPGFHPHSFDVAWDAVLYEVRSSGAALSVSASAGRARTRSRRELGLSLRCSIPDPSPDTTIPASAASGRLRFEGRQGARSGDPLSLLSVLRFRSARSRPGRAQRGEANP